MPEHRLHGGDDRLAKLLFDFLDDINGTNRSAGNKQCLGVGAVGFERSLVNTLSRKPGHILIFGQLEAGERADRFTLCFEISGDAAVNLNEKPYIRLLVEVNGSIAGYLEAQGKSISAFTSFKLAENEDMARLSAESIYQAALEADRADAEALFISCTAIRAVDVIEKIEQKLGKPVITAVQAMFWQSLRMAGYVEKVSGYGRLLRL